MPGLSVTERFEILGQGHPEDHYPKTVSRWTRSRNFATLSVQRLAGG
jgi:hypothetical protein